MAKKQEENIYHKTMSNLVYESLDKNCNLPNAHITTEVYVVLSNEGLLVDEFGYIPTFCFDEKKYKYPYTLDFGCKDALKNYSSCIDAKIKYRYCYLLDDALIIVGKLLDNHKGNTIPIYNLEKQVSSHLKRKYILKQKYPCFLLLKNKIKRRLSKSLYQLLEIDS